MQAMSAPTPPSTPVDDPETAAAPRRVVLVAGSGRSGTSTFAGILQRLGVLVPQPEVEPDETNPRGFAEPRWVVDFHTGLLRRSGVHGSDARPQAWPEVSGLVARDDVQAELLAWLEPHVAQAPELVIKDPRLSWWLDLWRAVVPRAGATPVVTTMLRAPTEVIASKDTYYGSNLPPANRAAAWVNMMLHTELHTRDMPRAFIRYQDLLADWRSALDRVDGQLQIRATRSTDEGRLRKVDEFVDPSLRRVDRTWDELEVPAWLVDTAEATWHHLDRLAEPGGDQGEVRAALDELRAAYATRYAEAEAVAQSSVLAERAAQRARVERLRRRAERAERERDGADQGATGRSWRAAAGAVRRRVSGRGGS